MAATASEGIRAEYERRMAEVRRGFEAGQDGLQAAAARSALVDELVSRLWAQHSTGLELGKGLAVVAIGGYGRAELFPHSDVDLLFCAWASGDAQRAQEAIRETKQELWDCGLRLGATTRTVAECERFETANAELGLSLLDRRLITGRAELFAGFNERVRTRLVKRHSRAMRQELLLLTRERHGRYGDTLFHLEPNIKDCPGGLRDAHVTRWLRLLADGPAEAPAVDEEFDEALRFLAALRCFLHFRAGRDDNTLDWQAQDSAAELGMGLGARRADAAFWMRSYFRNARTVERRLDGAMGSAGLNVRELPAAVRKAKLGDATGFRLRAGRIELDEASGGWNPAGDADIVLHAFAAMARTGARLSAASEERINACIVLLSDSLDTGRALWKSLCGVLSGPYAGAALRAMHALGVLELALPEFHGIDALVIRDAYHRYTVDEHTFVVIDTLHGLAAEPGAEASDAQRALHAMLRELKNPCLLYLAALLHDTGKARSGGEHAKESAGIANAVLARLELDGYDAALVLRLIEIHLEMSAALRRDIFDAAAVRAFASKVQTHEALRMLTLFTYADIAAVHPDALTPWKAENLWRLSMNAANQLDRNVDEERVHARASTGREDDDSVAGVLARLRGRETEVRQFLEGFPERYLKTRSAAAIQQQFEMTERLDEEPFQIALHLGIGSGAGSGSSSANSAVSEVTLVTRDRARLFADMAAALAAWGMNVVTADAFSNAAGVVVDSFRFTDVFRTLELNESESARFVASLRDMIAGRASAEAMLNSRRRGRRRSPRVAVATRVEFDSGASSHSTVMQVIAQDVPGLLRTLSRTLSAAGYNVEVALVDTEGETAIDVFYLTRGGERLRESEEEALRDALLEAIDANAR